MTYFIACAVVFICAYLVNITYITVFYHRGIAHKAIVIRPWVREFVRRTGVWVTGLDPKGWAVMHRFHHKYSDLPRDPHSPVQVGVMGVALAQLRSYEKVLIGILRGEKEITAMAKDLDFPVSWVNRKKLWMLPYLVHFVIYVVLGFTVGWLFGICYFLGMMSHPIQGWMVNAFGHRFGYQTYNNGDNSRNNTLVAWLVMGEGYQNNHHRFPDSPHFSQKWWELDTGYLLCLVLSALGLISLKQNPT